MADEPAVIPAAAPAAEAGAQGGEKLTGIAAAMQDFDQNVTPKPAEKPPEKAPAKPDDKKPVDKSVKPAVKPGEKPDKPAVKPSADEVDWEKVDPKVKGAHFKTRRELEDKIGGYEKRVQELEKGGKLSASDQKMVDEYQKRIGTLETELAQASYERSSEFKEKYIKAWDSQYQAAVKEISQLQITIEQAGPNGEAAKTRAATDADFQQILKLPPAQQDAAINDLFGRSANRVYAHMLELQRIERQAQAALQEHSKTIETRSKEQQMQLQREQQEYETSHKASIDELQKQYPDYFAPDEKDAEVTQSLNNGYEFVDKMLQMSEKFTVAERAAYNAVLRARAAGFLPTALKLKRAEGRVKELEDELTKYRDSDPGGGGEGGGGGEQTTKVGGIDAMASDFNKK